MANALRYYGKVTFDCPEVDYRPDLEMRTAQSLVELGSVLSTLILFYDRNGGANALDMMVSSDLVQKQPYYALALEQCGRVLGISEPTVNDFYRVVYNSDGPLFQ